MYSIVQKSNFEYKNKMTNVTLCPFEITDTHICYPTENTTLYSNNNSLVKWFILDPIYHNNYTHLNLYFYYRNNYEFHNTRCGIK